MAKGLTAKEREQEIRKILKKFPVDVLIRRYPSDKYCKYWVAVETYPPIWVDAAYPSQKTVSVSLNNIAVSRILKKMGVEIEGYTTKISYSQFKKLVGMFLMEMFTKMFTEFISFE